MLLSFHTPENDKGPPHGILLILIKGKRTLCVFLAISLVAICAGCFAANPSEPVEDVTACPVEDPQALTEEQALSVLEERLISIGMFQPGMKTDSGDRLYWDETYERILDGQNVYMSILRWESGGPDNVMANRRYGHYAVSVDGKDCYMFDLGLEVWYKIVED